MQAPIGTDWEEVTHRSDLEAVLRRTNLYRREDDGTFALKPVASVAVSKAEIIGDGEDFTEVWVVCPEYPKEVFQLHIGDRVVDVTPGEKIEISAAEPAPIQFEVKSKIVRTLPTIVRVRKP